MKRAFGPGLVVAASLMGCTPSKATLPVLPRNGSLSDRQQAYERARLTHEKSVFSVSWARADGKYGWFEVESLAQSYPETSAIYDSSNTRGLVLGSVVGAGGGLIGGTFGYNLAADDSRKMSSDTQVVYYAVGGSIIVLGLIVAAAWRNSADDLADVYNRNLRRDLGLPEAAREARSSLRLQPRIMGDGIGWRF